MKICHLTSAHDSTDVRIFLKECISLAAAGYDTYLVAFGDSREENGVHVIGLGKEPEGRLERMTKGAKRVYEAALKLDCEIYHIHDPELLPYGLRLKRHGKKVIFDSHENVPAQITEKTYLPWLIRKTVSKVYKLYETRVISRIDAVIVPCTFDGVNIFDGRAKKTCIIANYPKITDFFQKYDPNAEKKDAVCYIGSLSYDRGVQHLVIAAERAGIKLVLAGKFSDSEFEKTILNLPEFSCVDYLGRIGNDKVPEILNNCRIGGNILLDKGQYHHLDTFGVKVYECLSMGLPVLLPDCPYMRNMVEKYNIGICVKPDDPDDIAAAIRKLIDNPELASEMGRNGRLAVEREFNWTTQEKELLALYNELTQDTVKEYERNA